ncbi:MAG: ABC transporter permease subunit [Planctomycetota bacterium]
MNSIVRRLGLSFWYLLPANPILVRVVHGASRRPRHLWLRLGYLTAIVAVILLSLFNPAIEGNTSLGNLAKAASRTFQWASVTQLALMCFLAPVFTAGAITQERDAQTMNILLSTPLTNAQIVFGSLMSRLYFVIMLLISGLPVFLMTMIYGGVTASQVFGSFALSASTAFLTGALAIFVAMMGVGTRKTIFSFYMLIGLYLLAFYLFGMRKETWVGASPPNISDQKMSWLAPVHPFLALEVALNQVNAPPHAHLTDHSAIGRYMLAYPSAAYTTWTLLLSFVMTLASMFLVRRGAKSGEQTWFTRVWTLFSRTSVGEKTRKPRTVWNNPVAWREAKTRAGGGLWVRWAVIFAGAIVALVLFIGFLSGDFTADSVREWLAGLVAAELGVALIFASNTAATAMTKEKEAKSIDLLLSTPLTSKYILWGKLRGLVSFAAPLLMLPAIVLLIFGLQGLSGTDKVRSINIECFAELSILMLVYTACACVIGLKVSMVARKNVSAVMTSVGILIVLCSLLGAGATAVVESVGGEFAAFFAPFTPFTAVMYLVNPAALFETAKEFADGANSARAAALLGSLVATIIYTFIVWSLYTNLVREFDMTMRKQTGT